VSIPVDGRKDAGVASGLPWLPVPLGEERQHPRLGRWTSRDPLWCKRIPVHYLELAKGLVSENVCCRLWKTETDLADRQCPAVGARVVGLGRCVQSLSREIALQIIVSSGPCRKRVEWQYLWTVETKK
jgi:hypothetical protein